MTEVTSNDLGKHPDAWSDGPEPANHWMKRAAVKIDQLEQEIERLQKDRNECLEAFHILFRIFPEPK